MPDLRDDLAEAALMFEAPEPPYIPEVGEYTVQPDTVDGLLRHRVELHLYAQLYAEDGPMWQPNEIKWHLCREIYRSLGYSWIVRQVLDIKRLIWHIDDPRAEEASKRLNELAERLVAIPTPRINSGAARMKRVLALDVSLQHTGVALVEGHPPEIIEAYCIVTKKEAKKRKIYVTDDQVRRIRQITKRLDETIWRYRPALIVAELPTGGAQSASAAAGMGIAKAVVATVAQMSRLPLLVISPTDVKLAATGKKTASKAEVQAAIVRRWPGLGERFASKRSATGYTGQFEHIADALGALIAAEDHELMRMM